MTWTGWIVAFWAGVLATILVRVPLDVFLNVPYWVSFSVGVAVATLVINCIHYSGKFAPRDEEDFG